jgi:hypothetical protein
LQLSNLAKAASLSGAAFCLLEGREFKGIARRNLLTKQISDIFPEFAVHFVKRGIINSMASTAPKIPPTKDAARRRP